MLGMLNMAEGTYPSGGLQIDSESSAPHWVVGRINPLSADPCFGSPCRCRPDSFMPCLIHRMKKTKDQHVCHSCGWIPGNKGKKWTDAEIREEIENGLFLEKDLSGDKTKEKTKAKNYNYHPDDREHFGLIWDYPRRLAVAHKWGYRSLYEFFLAFDDAVESLRLLAVELGIGATSVRNMVKKLKLGKVRRRGRAANESTVRLAAFKRLRGVE